MWNNCVRLNKLILYCELKVVSQRRFISKITEKNVNEGANSQSANYCLNLVRQYDYENYLCTLLMKEKSRKSSFGIRAFNVEISKIASVVCAWWSHTDSISILVKVNKHFKVSDDKIGTIRLKFWYDAIDKIFDSKQSTIPEHPVIKEIYLAIRDHNLQKIYFSRLIKSRERPSNRGFVTYKELEQYAEDSVSSIYYLLTKIIKCESVDVDHALSHLGKAHGIVNLLRAQCRLDRSKGVCIPQETMLKHGVNQERILRSKVDDKGVQDCVFEIASLANSHLEKARNLSPKIPRDMKHLLLPAVGIERYLERLRKCDFNLSHPQLTKKDSMLPVVFYWNFLRKKY